MSSKPSPFLPMPDFLVETFQTPKDNDTQQVRILVGTRNDTLMRKGSAVWHLGATKAELETYLLVLNARECEVPLSEKEVLLICRSITGYLQDVPAYDDEGRRTMVIGVIQVREEVERIITHLLSQNGVTLFRNMDTLVEVVTDHQGKSIRCLDTKTLLLLLHKHFNWYQAPGKPPKKTDKTQKETT